MPKKKAPTIIQDTPDDMMDDNSLQSSILSHVQVFGFCHIIDNIVEAYRVRARRLNKQADILEKMYQRNKVENA